MLIGVSSGYIPLRTLQRPGRTINANSMWQQDLLSQPVVNSPVNTRQPFYPQQPLPGLQGSNRFKDAYSDRAAALAAANRERAEAARAADEAARARDEADRARAARAEAIAAQRDAAALNSQEQTYRSQADSAWNAARSA